MVSKRSNDDFPAELAAALRQDAARRCDRPAEFWNRQHAHIGARVRIDGRVHRSLPRFAWSAAAVLGGAALLLSTSSDRSPAPPLETQVDADQQLLVTVEQALAAGTPEALEPLTLLVESTSNPNDVPNSPKEQPNEN